jgi:glycosyltransferase involved in cell wall biosynthesis
MVEKKKKLRVGYILRKFPVLSETFILNEILELEAQGIEVEIFSVEKPNDPRFHKDLHKLKALVTFIPDVLKLNSLWKHRKKAVKKFRSGYQKAQSYALWQRSPTLMLRLLQSCYVANEAAKKKIDHFHAHFATRATSIAFLSSMISGIPYSFTAHAVDIFKETLNKNALKKKIEYANFVVGVSEYNKNYLTAISPISAQKIVKIHNGIDLNQFKSNNIKNDSLFTFLCVARFVEKKGHKVLIEACDILKKQGVNFQCLLIGQGTLQSDIECSIKEKGLKENVKILGPRTHDEVLEQFHQSHVYVLPCITGKDGNKDGLPVAIVEALACGIPVITTPMTGNPEVVKDLHNGLLVPFEDHQRTAEAMKMMIDDQALYHKLCSNARSSVDRTFNLKETAKSLVKQFEESAL